VALGRFHEGVYQFVGGRLLSLYQLFDSIGAMLMGKDKAGKTLTRKEYEKELKKVHAEIVNLQEWVKLKRLKVCVVFEGRDGAGKGGTIKAITERVSPRVFRVVALPAPTEREKSQMYASAISPICRRPARWSSSTGAGTTVRASSESWAFAPSSRPRSS
jgi:hypothetical protein